MPTTESTSSSNLTYGEKIMGVTFNPSGNKKVDVIKGLSARLADALNEARMETQSPEAKRLFSISLTNLQGAQMFGVKGATWVD